MTDADIRDLMRRALPALERAARDARALAYRAQTPLVVVRDGVIVSEVPTSASDDSDDSGHARSPSGVPILPL